VALAILIGPVATSLSAGRIILRTSYALDGAAESSVWAVKLMSAFTPQNGDQMTTHRPSPPLKITASGPG
jgi:hypothetical protein